MEKDPFFHGRGDMHSHLAVDQHDLGQAHVARHLAPAFGSGHEQGGGGGIGGAGIRVNHRNRQGAAGGVSAARVDDVMIAYALVVEKALIVP